MKLMVLAKKEAYDILTNRIYILVVFVQILIILGAFGLAAVSSLATDPSLIDKWGISSTLEVGLASDLKGSPLAQNLQGEHLKLVYYKDIKNASKQVGRNLVAVVEVSSPPKEDILVQIDTANIFYPVVSDKINDAVNKFKLERKLNLSGVNQSEIGKIQNPIKIREMKVNKNNQANLALDSYYFAEIMYGFIIPFVLLLPFFLASNIVTDSIVGERERKTFEVLLMTPLSSSMVIVGKILPILSFSMLQSIVWILLLDLLKVPVYNPLLMVIILFFMGLGFIGAGILISMLVDSTKEANSAITLLLVFVTFILFLPLFIRLPFLGGILNMVPTVLMVKLSSTPVIQPELLLLFLPTIIISTLIFTITVRYFRHERAIRL
jgi:ABC-2 type transport system permease protein